MRTVHKRFIEVPIRDNYLAFGSLLVYKLSYYGTLNYYCYYKINQSINQCLQFLFKHSSKWVTLTA